MDLDFIINKLLNEVDYAKIKLESSLIDNLDN